MKFQALGLCLATLLLASCAGKTETYLSASETPAEENVDLLPPAPPLPAVPLAERPGLETYFKSLVAKEASLRDLLAKENELVFSVNKPEEGYLKVTSPAAPTETFVFTLYRGESRDLVLQEKKDCEPDCAYAYAAYEFAGPAYRRVLLSSVFPMSEIGPKVRRIVPKLGKKAGVVPNWPRVEHLRLSQAPEKTNTPLFVLREITRKKREELSYFDVGTLRWDPSGQQFAFNALPKAKSLGALDAGKANGPETKKKRRRR
ncbi:MAG: hypothetical protein EOP11_13800 [Proteobacteria bacterium]|nr:MAG: hypothetical protein EOP11_13800 [Pseudomonadota bacterium]